MTCPRERSVRRPVRPRRGHQFRPEVSRLEGRVVLSTYTWTGAVSANWSNSGNWQGGFLPPSDPTTILVFPFTTGASPSYSYNDMSSGASPFVVQALEFETTTFRLTGGPITPGVIAQSATVPNSTVEIDDAIQTNGGLAISASSTTTLTLTGPVNNTNSGLDLEINGPINGPAYPPVDGKGLVTFQGRISGSAGFSIDGGTVNLLLPNSYTGGTRLFNSSTLFVGDNAALGTGLVNLVDGYFGATTAVTIPNPLAVASARFVGNAPVTFTGPVGFPSGSNSSYLANAPLTFVGNVDGSQGQLGTLSPGTLIFSGTNSLGHVLVASNVTLVVNGSQPSTTITLLTGTLTGTGVVGPLPNLYGTIQPGNGGVGILTVNGGLTMPGFASLAVTLSTGASGYGQLAVQGGGTTLQGPTLAATLGSSAPLVGQAFTVLSSPGGLTGTFAGAPQGAILAIGGLSFQINYSSTAVTLIRVADSTPPAVLSVSRTDDQVNGTAVVLTFNKPLDPARAALLRNYQLRGAGPDGVLGTPDDVKLGVRAAVYDRATNTVTLYARRRPVGTGPVAVSVEGRGVQGLADSAGHHLVGRYQGKADGR